MVQETHRYCIYVWLVSCECLFTDTVMYAPQLKYRITPHERLLRKAENNDLSECRTGACFIFSTLHLHYYFLKTAILAIVLLSRIRKEIQNDNTTPLQKHHKPLKQKTCYLEIMINSSHLQCDQQMLLSAVLFQYPKVHWKQKRKEWTSPIHHFKHNVFKSSN